MSKNHDENKVLHIMVTRKCNKSCPLCCNKFYDIDNLPVVTDYMLKTADILCITGGEPDISMEYPRISTISNILHKYSNIKEFYIYINGSMLTYNILATHRILLGNNPNVKIGYTISPKDENDWNNLLCVISEDNDPRMEGRLERTRLFAKYSRIYCFDDSFGNYENEKDSLKLYFKSLGFDVIDRQWETIGKETSDNVIYSRLHCMV